MPVEHHRRKFSDQEEETLAMWLKCGLEAKQHTSAKALQLLNDIAAALYNIKVCALIIYILDVTAGKIVTY